MLDKETKAILDTGCWILDNIMVRVSAYGGDSRPRLVFFIQYPASSIQYHDRLENMMAANLTLTSYPQWLT